MDVGLDEIFVNGLLPLHHVSTDFDWKSRMEVSVFSFLFFVRFFNDNPLGFLVLCYEEIEDLKVDDIILILDGRH